MINPLSYVGGSYQPINELNGLPSENMQQQIIHPQKPLPGKTGHDRDKDPEGDGVEANGGHGGVGKWKDGPVKNACLSCRTKKAKCDGTRPICGQCVKKGAECVYVKSRRGGARRKREAMVTPSALQEFLKRLDGLLGIPEFNLAPAPSNMPTDTTNILRRFSSRDEILRCYYNEVHPFLPVMPPRQYMSEVSRWLLPESPFLYAAQTILTLVPHGLDPRPASAESKYIRSRASRELANKTMALIDRMEDPKSRIECVQALSMLSLWEWGCAASPSQSRARSAQAVQIAMELGLHELDRFAIASAGTGVSGGRSMEGVDWKQDMSRRTWWCAYVHQLMSCIVSGASPVLSATDPRIKVNFPVCAVNDNAWPNWILTIQQCATVFALVNNAYYSQQVQSAAWGERPVEMLLEEKIKVHQEMFEIDRQVMELMQEAERTSVIELVPGGEEEVVRNQQLSARLGLAVMHIHIHRHQAFPEVSLFSKRICGLPINTDNNTSTPAPSTNSSNSAKGILHPDMNHINPLLVSSPHHELSYGAANELIANSMINRSISPESNSQHSQAPIQNLAQNQSQKQNPLLSTFYQLSNDMWQPETYPDSLPAPWFSQPNGAASLYAPVEVSPRHLPPLVGYQPVPPLNQSPASSNSHLLSSPADRSRSVSTDGGKKHNKAWGVSSEDKVVAEEANIDSAAIANRTIFPPGVSLARCATAAHTIVRLEVLHRSAVIAMWEGPPKWLPFCACGLVTGAYAFLLLALACQQQTMLLGYPPDHISEEVDALLNNVRVILAGLDAYGVMWAGIEVMAGEVRAALEAAVRLPHDVHAQIMSASISNSSTPPNQREVYNEGGEEMYEYGEYEYDS
ncbi:hypothetical protein M231_00602 [Tremella mesenterica]|uniref:Zn(2)-C6 fungal-type domain-containing protein n=1 Tax=Tremella mesenterica TaxID=5217 RepID=A0A4Q1BVR8_TREME|nr:hypothetical protein M231_00602 [Tremella mesenterica]